MSQYPPLLVPPDSNSLTLFSKTSSTIPEFICVLVAGLLSISSPPSLPEDCVDSKIGDFNVDPSKVRFASPLKGVLEFPVAVTT